MLATVSAIVAFDRWPESGGASTVERVAVDRPSVRRVETVLVSARRPAPVVRGVFVERPAGASATALGAGDVFLVGDREPTGQSDGGGFGPPPPPVPFAAPGEGGGPARFAGSGASGGPGKDEPSEPTIIRQATCGAREALGQAGGPLDPACSAGSPGQRGTVGQAVDGTAAAVTDILGLGQGLQAYSAAAR